MNMVFYLLTSTVMTYFFFNPQQYNLVELIFANDNNLILVFILITLVVQLLAGLTRKLSIQARALQELNSQKQESINHIMSLYQIIEAMNNNNSKDKLFETLAEYTAKLTKSDLCFCWLPGNIIEEDLFKVSNNLCNINLREIQLELRNMSEHSNTFSGAQELSLAGYYFLVMPIMIPSTPIGILAVQKQCNNSLGCYEQSNKLLEFLSGLSTVILERFNMEEIEDSLLIMNEQNRIANEIHDSVSQRLFSISYAIHGILGRWKTMSKKELYEYLIEINESSSNAMQELRNAIYQLSSKKKGEKTLQVTLKEFLDNIGKLHHIIVDLQIEGNEGLLSLSIKKAITRIIREACNNAVRHGRCQNINLILKINADLIYLSIADDGNGFTIINDISGKEYGLGLSNIQSLVSSFNGNININSTVGEGTNIKITMPIKEYIKLSKEDTLYESNIG
jgi:NarL family two-component system sensor histidine kinase LiaS